MKTTLLTTALGLVLGFNSARSEETKETKAKKYPLEVCVVSDEKLGGHGKPYVFTHEGQEVKLCCKACLKDFNKEPEKYLEKLKGDTGKRAE